MENKSDDELLAAFVTAKSEEAFAEIVRRHSPVVFGACRRILGSSADADDAAQAVFLTLAQKAASLGKVRSLAGWLYEVAYRLAQHVRLSKVKRQVKERQAVVVNDRAGDKINDRDQLRELLDEELSNVPEKYRVPLILHHFEGKSPEETGAILGCTTEAAAMRLSRGRGLLRERLIRRGVMLSALLLSTHLSAEAAVAVPQDFVKSTAKLAVSGAALAGSTAAGALTPSVAAMMQLAGTIVFWKSVKAFAPVALMLGVAAVAAASPFLSPRTPAVAKVLPTPEKTTPTPETPAAQPPAAVTDNNNPGLRLDDARVWKRFGNLNLRATAQRVDFDVVNPDPQKWEMAGLLGVESYDLRTCTVSVKFKVTGKVDPTRMFLNCTVVPKVDFDDEERSFKLAVEQTLKRIGYIPEAEPEEEVDQVAELLITRTEIKQMDNGKVIGTEVLKEPVNQCYLALRAGARNMPEARTFTIQSVTITRNVISKRTDF